MKQIEAIEKLEQAFEKFIQDVYDVDITVELTDEFAYYHDEEPSITIALGVTETNGFMEDLLMRYNVEIDENSHGLFYLLHELGHHFTWDKLEQEVHDHCDIMKKELDRVMNATYTDDVFKYFYYGCIDEQLATQWACAEYFKLTQYNEENIAELAQAVEQFYIDMGCDE